ncbi:MAG: hypothetical protein LC637_07665 [Xanthomonadaceae bacterium]|nr:hypothetical protein [Xanthomonadaceae bacterium]
MKYWLGSLFQRNAHSIVRRVYFFALRRLFGVFAKRQAVYFLSINNRRYKRVVFGDSREAADIESALLGFAPGEFFPALISRHENELLVEFVEGRAFEPARAADRAGLAAFLGTLYGKGSIETDPERMHRRLRVDLRFLVDAGLIDQALHDALARRAERIAPEIVRSGLDYVDPVAKNFVVNEDRLMAIDVESLSSNTALGTGIAKACVHWLEPRHKADFIGRVEQVAGLDLSPQIDFVELCFLVGWTKRKLLQGKKRSIRIDLLQALAAELDGT